MYNNGRSVIIANDEKNWDTLILKVKVIHPSLPFKKLYLVLIFKNLSTKPFQSYPEMYARFKLSDINMTSI